MPDWKSQLRELGVLSAIPEDEADIQEELAQHLEQVYRDALEDGATPEVAEQLALSELGDRHTLQKRLRVRAHPVSGRLPGKQFDSISTRVHGRSLDALGMAGLWQDLRFSLRVLRKSPLYFVVAVCTLALGISTSSAIFSVVNGVLLQPLSFSAPEDLALVRADIEGFTRVAAISGPELQDLRKTELLQDVAGVWGNNAALTDLDEPVRIYHSWVTANLFPMLGIEAIHGRTFLPEEEQGGSERVLLLSEGIWKSRYGGDPDIVGQRVELDDQPYTVVGVVPGNIKLPKGAMQISLAGADVFIPQTYWTDRDLRWLRVIARKRPDVTWEQAQTQLDNLVEGLVEEHGEYRNTGFAAHLVPLQQDVVRHARPAILVLMGAVVLLFLIACSNVSALVLARAGARERELAVRSALGAGRWRVIRQMLTENLLIAGSATALGVVLAHWYVGLLHGLAPEQLPRLEEIQIDNTVLGLAVATALLTAIFLSIAPTWRTVRISLVSTLRDGTRGTENQRRIRGRNLLVVAQIALSLVLIVGASLMMRSFAMLEAVNPGFDSEQVLTLRVPIAVQRFMEGHKRWRVYNEIQNSLKALPGVDSASGVSLVPLGSGLFTGAYAYDTASEESWGQLSADYLTVLPDYFNVMRVPLQQGRSFTSADAAEKRVVVMVDETLARQAWPDESPIGRRLKLTLNPSGNEAEDSWAEVIGVVGHVRTNQLQEDGPPQIYRPFWLDNPTSLSLLVRSAIPAQDLVPLVRQTIHQAGTGRPVYDFRPLSDYLTSSTADARFLVIMAGLFAGIAGLLAGVGLYGLLSYRVTRQTREFGVRLALGSNPHRILQMVLASGLRLVVIGTAIGGMASFWLMRLLEHLLFNTTPHDPIAFVSALALLLLVALAACIFPARRATKTDPIVALRCE